MARRSPPPADADVELDLVDENHHAYMSSSAPSTSSQAPMSSGIGATTTLPPGVASLARQGTQPSYALTLDTNAGEHVSCKESEELIVICVGLIICADSIYFSPGPVRKYDELLGWVLRVLWFRAYFFFCLLVFLLSFASWRVSFCFHQSMFLA